MELYPDKEISNGEFNSAVLAAQPGGKGRPLKNTHNETVLFSYTCTSLVNIDL